MPRNRVKHRPLLCALVLFGAYSSDARTWHVLENGTGDAPTIQAAIDSSTSGDSVVVGAGTYFENLTTQGKQLALVSQSGAQATVIDGAQINTVIRFRGGGVVDGFTIRNGRQESRGAGLWIEGSALATIRNNIIEDNTAGEYKTGRGAGVYLDQFTRGVVVEDNVIRRNTAGDVGGGLLDDSSFFSPPHNVIRRNIVQQNVAGISGGGLKLRFATATDNLVVSNWATYFGGGVSTVGPAVVRNNTVVSNLTENNFLNGAGIHACGSAIVEANIVVRNGSDGNANAGAGIRCCSAASVACNDVWGNDIDFSCSESPPPSNFSIDPLFCSEQDGNYHLSPSSQCAPGGPCGLVGAFGVACGQVRVEPVRWGHVKSLYR